MAQTIIAQPQRLTPAYNPIKYIVDSTNKNRTGFRYIFQVYNGATLKGTFNILPTIVTGYGESDLSKFLSSYVSWDFDPTITTDFPALKSYYNYDVKVGEEYLYEISYTSALTSSGTNTRINVANIFQVGDQINILQDDGGTANPLIEGLHTVIAVSGTWIDVNVPFSSITDVNINGTINYADNRKVVTYDITEFTNRRVFNGAFTWGEFPSFEDENYNLNDPSKLWFTNQPKSEFYSTLGQDLWLNARVRLGKLIYFENNDGEVFTRSVDSNDSIVQVAVGVNNLGTLLPVSGTLPLIKDDTTYYEFWYSEDGVNQDSIRYRVNLDKRTFNEEYQICFLDRLGSFSSFAFQLKSYERGEVTRDEFNKDVKGFVNATEWSYNLDEFGFNTFNINVTKTIELNTNWLNEQMSAYFNELISSPQTFIKKVTYSCIDGIVATSTAYVPCIVQTNSYEVFKQRNKNLIKQSIVVKLANNDNVNG
jgi:hypothetical protein